MSSSKWIISDILLQLVDQANELQLQSLKLGMSPELLLFDRHLRDVVSVLLDRLNLDLSEQIAAVEQLVLVIGLLLFVTKQLDLLHEFFD